MNKNKSHYLAPLLPLLLPPAAATTAAALLRPRFSLANDISEQLGHHLVRVYTGALSAAPPAPSLLPVMSLRCDRRPVIGAHAARAANDVPRSHARGGGPRRKNVEA